MLCFWLGILLLVLLVVAAAPRWPYSRQWGYFPTAIVGLIVLFLFFMWVFGLVPWYGYYRPWW